MANKRVFLNVLLVFAGGVCILTRKWLINTRIKFWNYGCLSIKNLADNLLQHRESSIFGPATYHFFQGGMMYLLVQIMVTFFFSICSDHHLYIRYLLYVTIQPFWTEVRHKVYSGKERVYDLKLLWELECLAFLYPDKLKHNSFFFSNNWYLPLSSLLQCWCYRASLPDLGSNSWKSNWCI